MYLQHTHFHFNAVSSTTAIYHTCCVYRWPDTERLRKIYEFCARVLARKAETVFNLLLRAECRFFLLQIINLESRAKKRKEKKKTEVGCHLFNLI